jgi:PAS domain S-box-containing protein
MQAPVAIGIFSGPNYLVELINPPLCTLYGKSMEELQGKPIFEVLTQAVGKGFEQLLDQVRESGQPFHGRALEVPLVRNGHLETTYMDFVYEPFRQSDGIVIGVIVAATEVTDQVNAKRRIEEAEERARLSVDAVGLGTFDLNLQTGEMFTSDTFFRIFGSEHPLSWKEYQERIHPADRDIRVQAHEEAIKSGRLQYEARISSADGTLHTVRFEGKVYYENGVAVRMLGTVLDITEQKQLKEEQQKLITLVANSVDAMAILNLNGSTSYLNQAAKSLLGIQNEPSSSAVQMLNVHPTDGLFRLQDEIFPKVLKHKEWSGLMNVRHLQTGDLIPVYTNMTRIDDPERTRMMAVGVIMRDLRAEISAQQALEKSESLLRAITSAAPAGLWQTDEQGAITYINGTWVKWTEIPFEEQLGKGWLNAIVPGDREATSKIFSESLQSKAVLEAEFRINHADGTVRWCFADGHPQYNAFGSFTGYIGAFVDITEQKLLQQQKDNFIGIASHELKTPVTSLKAYTQILERMMLKKGDAREAAMINKMDGQLNRLTDLIGDLLDVTKINSGMIQFNNREFEFNELVLELLDDLQHTTDKHQLLDKLEPVGLIFGDKERLGQVIVNLITNAIKYSPESDQIFIRSSLSGTELIFSVQDFGIGISQANMDKVFEQFYRVSGDLEHTFPGLGLGLYISAEIIKREGGRIWLTSEEDKGSTFYFAIPLNTQ